MSERVHPPGDPEEREKAAYGGPIVSISDEMKTSYLDYAMSVIVSRAIPDLRDGLKPVHRRILYAMHESGNTHDKPYRKSARPVGDVMGKYHPHGDSAIYDALVRMAQDFSMSLPLLDGQGNFGSVDGDNPAAMRYTEVRMDDPASALLADIEKDTVDFQDNYDGKDKEPTVLPARFPNMLVNGAGGIAVGMATNIPPHNLGEVIDATLALIDAPELSVEHLIEFIPGPDFPTGGIILGHAAARKAYIHGRGSVLVRAKTHVEESRKDRKSIVIDEIPYQVNKVNLIEKIADTIRDKKIKDIAHVQDESDRHGIRIVIDLKRDSNPELVLNQLYRFTPMQTSFGCNMLALNSGRPEQLTLKDFLFHFINFREEVVARRTAFELRKARERSHILCGLAVAVANVDEIVATIRSSKDAAEARGRLIERHWSAGDILEYIKLIDDPSHSANHDGTYNLSERQARAILDLRLQRLTQLGVNEVSEELQTLSGKIREYLAILASRERIMEIISDELHDVKNQFAIPRRTEIADWDGELIDEDLIEREEMVVTVTQGGYIKRTALAEFRSQKRGGKGISGMRTKDEDVVTTLFVANTHTPLLLFTTNGMAYKLKTWQLPLGSRTSRGKAIVNILPIQQGVSLAALMPVDAPEEEWENLQIFFATSSGYVRKNALSDFTNVMKNGKIAMKLTDNSEIINVRACSVNDDVMLITNSGLCVRFPTTGVRLFKGRNSIGVKGINLDKDDKVVSMSVIHHFEATSEERKAYLKKRRAMAGVIEEDDNLLEDTDDEDGAKIEDISDDKFEEMKKTENLILCISRTGSGKISSSHDFRVTKRGGKGVKAMRQGNVVASFPVEYGNQIMLATSSGQSIRIPVDDISFRSRTAGGVIVFKTAEDEEVVSVALIADTENDES